MRIRFSTTSTVTVMWHVTIRPTVTSTPPSTVICHDETTSCDKICWRQNEVSDAAGSSSAISRFVGGCLIHWSTGMLPSIISFGQFTFLLQSSDNIFNLPFCFNRLLTLTPAHTWLIPQTSCSVLSPTSVTYACLGAVRRNSHTSSATSNTSRQTFARTQYRC